MLLVDPAIEAMSCDIIIASEVASTIEFWTIEPNKKAWLMRLPGLNLPSKQCQLEKGLEFPIHHNRLNAVHIEKSSCCMHLDWANVNWTWCWGCYTPVDWGWVIGWDCRHVRQLNLDSQRSSYLELVRLSCLLRVDKEVEGSFSGNERSRTSSNHDEEEEEVEGVAGELRDWRWWSDD